MSAKSICIIDDDNLFQVLLKKTIQKLNVFENIISFGNGKQALDAFQELIIRDEELPDIIILDINMPIMDGWQFMEAFVKLRPIIKKKVVVYVASSSIANEDINKAKSYEEISDYIVKPIDTATLMKLSEKALLLPESL